MLPLTSPRWAQLRHAYGPAADVPSWLSALATLPSSENGAEPWHSIWSALAHQGDVFDASFAAVPHVVNAIATAPERAGFDFFHFPAWVEICRTKSKVEVPADLQNAYWAALQRLPEFVAQASRAPWSAEQLVCCLAAIAVAKGHPTVAEVVLELSPETAAQYLDWIEHQ
jgi:hypothetical protein